MANCVNDNCNYNAMHVNILMTFLCSLPLVVGRQVLLSSSPPCDICKKISCEIRLELLNELFALMEMIIMSKYAIRDNDEDDIMI